MPRSSAVLAHPNSQPYGSDGRMFFIAKSTSSATQSSITGSPTPSIMKTSRQQTSQGGKDKSTYSQEASLANLSVQQDGDLERTMTATSGQRCYESSGRYSPLSSFFSCVRCFSLDRPAVLTAVFRIFSSVVYVV